MKSLKKVGGCFTTNKNFLRKKGDAIVFLLWFPIFMKKIIKFVVAVFEKISWLTNSLTDSLTHSLTTINYYSAKLIGPCLFPTGVQN